jgi:hypothetical protein
MMMVNIPLHVPIFFSIIAVCLSINAPGLFGKDEKMDKLTIRNQIAYHFKKVVKEVSQELFVSRRIDVSLLFQGIQVLNQTEQGVRKFCDKLPYALMASAGEEIRMAPYVLIEQPNFASFAEAKARCEATGMQLPEVYTNLQADRLSKFLTDKGISQVFAGIIPDVGDSIQRHIMTGFPIWRSGYDTLRYTNGDAVSMVDVLDDAHAKFLYTSGKKMVVSIDSPSAVEDKKYGSHTYRIDHKELSQIMAKIVCEPRWDGQTYQHFRTDSGGLPDFKVKSRFSRGIQVPTLGKSSGSFSGNRGLQDLCISVADQAKEANLDMTAKITDLLALVDITAHPDIGPVDGHRQKKSIFLAKFIFVTGVKLLWTLFGFMQKMRMSNRMKHLETALAATQTKVDQNSAAIQNMTRLIYGNSVAIGQLNIRMDNLDARVSVLEGQMGSLRQNVDGLFYRVDVILALLLIESLTIRTKHSMDSGYDVLKDIIHCAKMGQTSPSVLPVDQMELVQEKVRKVSTAMLDPDFAKMQSIVVSDPNDPRFLLVVVNVAAVSRQGMELVKLIPVPHFEASGAFSPVLDYDTILLNQASSTYSILNEQEEYDCLFNRCYVSSIEQSTNEKSCGIPQLYDRHRSSCLSESVTSTGVFLKPMLPDGVIFAFKAEVQAQLFCKDNDVIGVPRRLKGTGVLQLPNGCILTVTDDQGKITKVKGQPMYRMIDADAISLMANGPLDAIQATIGMNGTNKASTFHSFLEQKLSTYVKQIESVDSKMEVHQTHIWSLTGLILGILLTVVAVMYGVYRYSDKFRMKIRLLRERITELSQQILHVEVNALGVPRSRPSPVVPPRPVDVLIGKIKESQKKRSKRIGLGDGSQSPKKEHTYIAMSDVAIDMEGSVRYTPSSSCFRPVSHLGDRLNDRCYPRLTPMMDELRNSELGRLKEESEEVSTLCTVTNTGAIPKRQGL